MLVDLTNTILSARLAILHSARPVIVAVDLRLAVKHLMLLLLLLLLMLMLLGHETVCHHTVRRNDISSDFDGTIDR